MAEDIVTRLLDVVCWCNEFDGVCDACQAADEINRLRRFKAEAMAVLDRWQAVADLVPTERRSLGEHWADIVAAEIERLRKAIVDYVMTISDCYATPATDSDALELLKQAVRGD